MEKRFLAVRPFSLSLLFRYRSEELQFILCLYMMGELLSPPGVGTRVKFQNLYRFNLGLRGSQTNYVHRFIFL